MTQEASSKMEEAVDKEITVLKSHKVTIQEINGILSVTISPFNEDFMDCSVIQHDVDENVIRVSTMREVRTDAQKITRLEA